MRKVYVLYAHPNPQDSRVNRAMVAALSGLENVVVRDLYGAYPDGRFDQGLNRSTERAAVEACDALVFQFPMYWYSSPPLLKQWQDDLLAHGWAFGTGGTALRGKPFCVATTLGEQANGFQADHRHGHSAESFLLPMEQTARYCGMMVQSPFLAFGCARFQQDDVDRTARRYKAFIIALRDGADKSSVGQSRNDENCNDEGCDSHSISDEGQTL